MLSPENVDLLCQLLVAVAFLGLAGWLLQDRDTGPWEDTMMEKPNQSGAFCEICNEWMPLAVPRRGVGFLGLALTFVCEECYHLHGLRPSERPGRASLMRPENKDRS